MALVWLDWAMEFHEQALSFGSIDKL